MTDDRWHQVTEIFHAAAELTDGAAREAYLGDACRDDPSLRAEVEALLAGHGEAGSFGERPLAPEPSAADRLSSGTRLGPHEIRRLVGAGGMGEVYEARDTRLDRVVAVKVLPAELGSDPERRARFVREAKTIAKLNHPHICTLHDVGRHEDTDYLVMELLEGETLADRLRQGPLPIDDALHYGAEIADALAAAHKAGIVHRDLKPGNIMLTKAGAKLLDFGLAKLKPPVGTGESTTQHEVTAEGAILGTLQYMAPEQLEGRDTDARTDIFAFGAVLYEMLTGERAFKGESQASLVSAILRDEPNPVTSLQPRTPAFLDHIVDRCLRKDPDARWQSAADLVAELQWVSKARERSAGQHEDQLDAAREPASSGGRSTASRLRLAAGAIIVIVVVGLIWRVELTEPRPSVMVGLAGALQVTSVDGREDVPTWSPDEQFLAYQSNQDGDWDIWVSQIGIGEPLNRTRDYEGDDLAPSWSPDGRIAFYSDRDGGGIWLMPAVSGAAQKLISAAKPGTCCTALLEWSSDGEELAYFVREQGKVLVEITTVSSGESRRLELPNTGQVHRDLSWSPDGRFMSYVTSGDSPGDEITRLWVLNVDTGAVLPLTEGDTLERSPQWGSDSGSLYFVSNRGGGMDLWHQILDDGGQPAGPSQPVWTGGDLWKVRMSPSRLRVAFSRGRQVANLWRVPVIDDRPATWADAEQLTFDRAYLEFVDVSPDGRDLLVTSDRAGNSDIWTMRADGGEMRQVTVNPSQEWMPQWSPDKSQVLFYSSRSGNRDLWVMPISGGRARQLTTNPAQDQFAVWSPDGRQVAFESLREGNGDIFVLTLSEVGLPIGVDQLTRHLASDRNPHWSADGTLVFESDRAAEGEGIGARHLWTMSGDGSHLRQLTTGPAVRGQWSTDAKRVFYKPSYASIDVWTVSVANGFERPATDLAGKNGVLERFDVHGGFIYFTWRQDQFDISVMDAVWDEEDR